MIIKTNQMTYTIGMWSDHELTPQCVVDEIKIQAQLAMNNKRYTRGAVSEMELYIMLRPIGKSSDPINTANFKVTDANKKLLGYFDASKHTWTKAKRPRKKLVPLPLVIKPESRVLRSYKTGAEYDADEPYEVYNAHGWRGCEGDAWVAYNTVRISSDTHRAMLGRSSIIYRA